MRELAFFKKFIKIKDNYIKGGFFKNSYRLFKKIARYVKKYGVASTVFIIKSKFKADNQLFDIFIKKTEADILKTEYLDYKPLISFVIPVYNVLDYQLRECIDSILNQTYDNYEIVLADDKSSWESVRKVLGEYENNTKITIIYRKENGHISRCTNTAISAAKGEFIAFMDCDDIISPNTVYEITKILNENKNLDFIYTDENKITNDSKKRHFPHFKPDWSPDTLMNSMYTNHLGVYRKTIVDKIGGLRVGYEGAQDYDFTLRFTEKTNRVGHIPKILYHWRERPESVASSMDSKPYILDIVKKIKIETFKRRGLNAEIKFLPVISHFAVTYKPKSNPLVSVIISSKNDYKVFKRCLKSVINKTKYKNYEIIVINSENNNINNKDRYLSLFDNMNYISVKYDNLYKKYNVGAKAAKGDYFLFLKDSVQIIKGDWLENMLGQASIEYSGAVGAKILFPRSNITKDCGITNLKNGPTSVYMGYTTVNYSNRDRLDYNYIAVSAVCMCIDKNKFYNVGGFDERFSGIYGAADFCFSLYENGFFNVSKIDAEIYDYDIEKKTSVFKQYQIFYDKHPLLKGKDPFYSVNFSDNKTDFSFNMGNFAQINDFIGQKNLSYIKNLITKNNVNFCVDDVKISDVTEIYGWAFFRKSFFNNFNQKFVLLVDKNNEVFIFKADSMLRTDVSGTFRRKKSLNLSGFICNIKTDSLKKGYYKIGMLLINKITQKKGAFISELSFEIC